MNRIYFNCFIIVLLPRQRNDRSTVSVLLFLVQFSNGISPVFHYIVQVLKLCYYTCSFVCRVECPFVRAEDSARKSSFQPLVNYKHKWNFTVTTKFTSTLPPITTTFTTKLQSKLTININYEGFAKSAQGVRSVDTFSGNEHHILCAQKEIDF